MLYHYVIIKYIKITAALVHRGGVLRPATTTQLAVVLFCSLLLYLVLMCVQWFKVSNVELSYLMGFDENERNFFFIELFINPLYFYCTIHLLMNIYVLLSNQHSPIENSHPIFMIISFFNESRSPFLRIRKPCLAVPVCSKQNSELICFSHPVLSERSTQSTT